MVDPGRVRSLLDRLGEETRELRRLAQMSPEELRADPDRLSAVKYRFVVALEVCIDIGEHIISSQGLEAPKDFADTFSVLGSAAYVAPETVPTLQDMARFRNLLVHGYQRVDDDRVVEILRSRLDDLDAFRASIAKALTD